MSICNSQNFNICASLVLTAQLHTILLKKTSNDCSDVQYLPDLGTWYMMDCSRACHPSTGVNWSYLQSKLMPSHREWKENISSPHVRVCRPNGPLVPLHPPISVFSSCIHHTQAQWSSNSQITVEQSQMFYSIRGLPALRSRFHVFPLFFLHHSIV